MEIADSNLSRFPTGLFVTIVTAICAALAGSAGYGYFTLSRLRTEYLANHARQVASVIDAQTRGPGRHDPVLAQRVLDENFDNFGQALAFIAIGDGSGSVLASRNAFGQTEFGLLPPGYSSTHGSQIFTLSYPLLSRRQNQRGFSSPMGGRQVQVGLFVKDAEFIRRQAIVHIAATTAAILMLVVLAIMLLRILGRFLTLKTKEESSRHLKAIGSMAAVLAHEIRNPLGAMKGLTQLMQEQIPQDHGTQALMRTVVAEAERLEKLVSDLLTFARPRPSDRREFDFNALIADVVSMLEPKFRSNSKKLQIVSNTGPIVIRPDEDGLRQVLLNALLNAFEFTPQGGSVLVGIKHQPRGNTLVVEIDDSGPGLRTQNPEELFEPFTTTKINGTGLGLAISRRIVESLGGSIVLSDIPGGGTRCSILLPANSPNGKKDKPTKLPLNTFRE